MGKRNKSYLIPAPCNFEFGLKPISYAGYSFEIPALLKTKQSSKELIRKLNLKLLLERVFAP
jgi:hypothetical protein